MSYCRIILSSAWVGACSLAAFGGAYWIMHAQPPVWEHIGWNVVRFARASIRISARIEPIIQQIELDQQPPAEQAQPQSGG